MEAEFRELLETEPAWTGARGEMAEGGGSVHPSLLLRNPRGSVRGGPPRSRGRGGSGQAWQPGCNSRPGMEGGGRPPCAISCHTHEMDNPC